MRIKTKGDSGSPCLRPLVGVNVLDGEPLTRIQKLDEVTRAITHLT